MNQSSSSVITIPQKFYKIQVISYLQRKISVILRCSSQISLLKPEPRFTFFKTRSHCLPRQAKKSISLTRDSKDISKHKKYQNRKALYSKDIRQLNHDGTKVIRVSQRYHLLQFRKFNFNGTMSENTELHDSSLIFSVLSTLRLFDSFISNHGDIRAIASFSFIPRRMSPSPLPSLRLY